MINPANCFAIFGVLSLILPGCTTTSRHSSGSTTSSPGIIASGMARLDDRRFLVVNDTQADQSGPRLGLIDLDRGGSPRYSELSVNWDEFGGPAHELESVCAIPGRENEFLAAESRYVGERFGRIFHIIIVRDERGTEVARIEQVLQLPQLYDRIEGMVIGHAANGELIVLFGERGSADLPARISWGRLDFVAGTIRYQFMDELHVRTPGLSVASGPLDCTDLFIDDRNRLWVVATFETGGNGPFQSVIYRFGTFDARQRRPVISLDPIRVAWTLEGFRVKAIDGAPDDSESLCFISDDGHLGGVWRPLMRPRKPWEQ